MPTLAMTVELWGRLFFFSDLDVGACIFQENVPIETFNISIEITQNKQQYGTNNRSRENFFIFISDPHSIP